MQKSGNILILENNIKIINENIEYYKNSLTEMQTSEEINKTRIEQNKLLAEMKEKNPRASSQIKEMEDYVFTVTNAYVAALAKEKEIKKSIKDAEDSLVDTVKDIETQKQLLKKGISQSYKNEIATKINNIQTWLDFFDGKNTTITEFLQLIDTRGMMQKELDNIIPMKDAPQYQQKLEAFLTEWGL